MGLFSLGVWILGDWGLGVGGLDRWMILLREGYDVT